MALTKEWRNRIKRWQDVLWKLTYRPLAKVEVSGFATQQKLSAEQALSHDFRPMPEGTPWGAKWEYLWLKARVTLPDEAKGKRIVLRLDPGGESLVWIDGKVMGSIGWAHKEITLTRKAKGGETYDVLVEAYGGHGRITVGDGAVPFGVETVPEPPATQRNIKDCTVGVWLEDVYQTAIDLTILFELRDHLDPNSLRVDEIDQGLRDATMIIDPELPEEEMLETVRAGRERMKALLEAKNGSTAPTLYAFGHAHIDVAWLWPLAETERKIARTAINQLALFEEYPHFRFLQSQPHLYWMLQRDYPELYQRWLDAVKTGNVIADGGMWVEADTNVAGGEALIRQVLYGRKFFRDELGVESRVLWLPDVFGYSGALPQILAGCGMMGFATTKITWAYNGGEPFPYTTFWWEGIDGTRLPASIFSNYNAETRPNSVMPLWNNRLQKDGISKMMLSYGWGDGGGGPTRDHVEFLSRSKDLEGMPRIQPSSPEEYFTDMLAENDIKEVYVGELYFQAHRGTYTSQARTKRGNRKSEFALREAEIWATAARALKGFDFTAETLTVPWRKLMFNQFHDILPGSSIDRVYEEAEATFEEVIVEAQQTAQNAVEALTGAGEGTTVFNSLSWERTALVNLPEGEAEVVVPPCGWKTVRAGDSVNAGFAALTRLGDTYVLENELIRAVLNERGEVTSLVDKASEREFMAGAGNKLCLYKDVPDNWDAWDLDSMAEDQPVAIDEPVTIEVLSAGPRVVRLALSRKLSRSTLHQIISLRSGSRRIDFETTLDWQESHKLLKVAFPVNMHASEVISEIQFGHLRRPNHKSRPFDADRFEVSNHKWSALAEENAGAAVLNDCKYGLSARGNSINLTLLKSPLAPDMTADKGEQHVTYALYTWTGCLADSNVVQESYNLNAPLWTVKSSGGEGSLFKVDAKNIIIDTVKPAEDGSNDIIVRMFECMRSTTRCTLSSALLVKSALQTNMVEEEVAQVDWQNQQAMLEFRPFEIKTVRLRL